jgi:apolipoprotein D and lipocalin family protein
MNKNILLSLTLLSMIALSGCASASKRPPLKTVEHLDLGRFMGEWYVIGTIPWFVEKNNVGTMDIYRMRPDGRIAITYVFHKKELSAPRQEMHAVGTILDKTSNARWGVQFLWPFQAPYLVIDLAPDDSTTIIGYPSRNLIWIMARNPVLSEKTYQSLLQKAASQGYDITRIVKVRQAR